LNGVAATRILEEVTDLEGRTRVNTEEKPPIYENRFRRNVVTRWIPMEWRSAGWQIRVSAQILEVFSTPKVPANVQRPKGE
jgi:hypothetical protein